MVPKFRGMIAFLIATNVWLFCLIAPDLWNFLMWLPFKGWIFMGIWVAVFTFCYIDLGKEPKWGKKK